MKTVAKLRRFNAFFSEESNDEVSRQIFIKELDLELFPFGKEDKFFVAQKANFGLTSLPTEFYFTADCAEDLLDSLALTWATDATIKRIDDNTSLWSIVADGDIFSLQILEDKVRQDLSTMDEDSLVFLAQRIKSPRFDPEFLEVELTSFIKETGYAPY